MKRPPTKAQQWQRLRYQTKGSVCSTIKLLNYYKQKGIFTFRELSNIGYCIEFLEEIDSLWEENNSDSKGDYLS